LAFEFILFNYCLVEELAALGLNDSTSNGNSPTTSDTFNAVDFFSATGARPTVSSSRKSSTTKRPKRLNDK